jgi:hypothetical protein
MNWYKLNKQAAPFDPNGWQNLQPSTFQQKTSTVVFKGVELIVTYKIDNNDTVELESATVKPGTDILDLLRTDFDALENTVLRQHYSENATVDQQANQQSELTDNALRLESDQLDRQPNITPPTTAAAKKFLDPHVPELPEAVKTKPELMDEYRDTRLSGKKKKKVAEPNLPDMTGDPQLKINL